MEWTYSLEKINEVAKEFLAASKTRTVITFHGAMGAGKTTFIHALCDVLGVKDVVGSPTFSIINEYEYVPVAIGSESTRRLLYHIDLYRLKDEEEALRAGVEEVLYSGHFCLVEWPGKAPHLFPPDTLHAYIEIVNGKTRHLKITDI